MTLSFGRHHLYRNMAAMSCGPLVPFRSRG
jgi:hypothetical protein